VRCSRVQPVGREVVCELGPKGAASNASASRGFLGRTGWCGLRQGRVKHQGANTHCPHRGAASSMRSKGGQLGAVDIRIRHIGLGRNRVQVIGPDWSPGRQGKHPSGAGASSRDGPGAGGVDGRGFRRRKGFMEAPPSMPVQTDVWQFVCFGP